MFCSLVIFCLTYLLSKYSMVHIVTIYSVVIVLSLTACLVRDCEYPHDPREFSQGEVGKFPNGISTFYME